MSKAEPTSAHPGSGRPNNSEPLPSESHHRVVVDVLASVVIDLLLQVRPRVRGEHEATTR